ncbi:hypothetical protein [Microbulbifer sp. TYP-18]|uniref:hypothetical protein n=1 Tax=Microbulbifer sp. TYP-18 TaxID=3230024 RepID=UPI0034C5C159
MREIKIWIAGVLCFLIYRFLFNSLLSTGAVVGVLFLVLSMFWFIVPFLSGKDIFLPRFSNTKFKKGADDSVRIFLFLLGLGMFYVSLEA